MSSIANYKEFAEYYDYLYAWKNYNVEAIKIKQLIKRYQKSEGNDLLEIACGTGNHLPYLDSDFNILATDANHDMLAIARKKVQDIQFKQVDMVNFELKKNFDVILCLFSSIGYVKTYKNLRKTLNNFAHHLKPGGIVIIEPWFTAFTYQTGLPTMHTYSDDIVKIARLCVSKKRGMLSVLDMHYLVAEKNKTVKQFMEHHELAMFETDRMLNLMVKSGLKAKFIKNGLMKDRGLYIGIKI